MAQCKPFLPVSASEMRARGWTQPDFVYVTADAYVDHPSFGLSIISRVLERAGYKVCMLPQPDWHTCKDFLRFGTPRLGFLVSGGVIDSMVNHYTVAKKPRAKDVYSPGGEAGHRPDRATVVYCNRIREAYGALPILIGGVEASLRRFAHYDYWDNRVRSSLLVDSGADLLMYGMGERTILAAAKLLEDGLSLEESNLPGTCVMRREKPDGYLELAPMEVVAKDKRAYAQAFLTQYEQQDPVRGQGLCQKDGKRYLVQHPPAMPLSTGELDRVYSLPYQRAWHPMYDELGGVPALEEVKFSLASSRGCFGACNFCALTFHQGRIVTSRSKESLVEEAKQLTHLPDFKGYIHDVGGPTANFRHPACADQLKRGACTERQCLFPAPCKHLDADHSDYITVLRALRALPDIKKVFIRSGIRYDYLLADKKGQFLDELVKYHVSGQLKIAPEHTSPRVLAYMGKPGAEVFEQFVQKFNQANERAGLKQFLVPYLMSSHPGSTLGDAIMLAEYLKKANMRPEQVQDFYPTPGTLSTAMFYTELDPRDMTPVYVAKNPKEKAMQRALMQFTLPQNRPLVREALRKAGRTDLIGTGPQCLIWNDRPAPSPRWAASPPAASAKAAPPAKGKPPKKSSGDKKFGQFGRFERPSAPTKK
ncbi:MAG: YgiQ family radical SAM protein [Clostridia bacterium]